MGNEGSSHGHGQVSGNRGNRHVQVQSGVTDRREGLHRHDQVQCGLSDRREGLTDHDESGARHGQAHGNTPDMRDDGACHDQDTDVFVDAHEHDGFCQEDEKVAGIVIALH
jgi:hypothetical protein